MKAAQIKKYSRKIDVKVSNIPVPKIKNNEVLIKVKTAAVNPVDLLTSRGELRLLRNHTKPFTLGTELTGIIDSIGSDVTEFKKGDSVYTSLPMDKIGAFAEYVVANQSDIWFLPKNLDFNKSVAVPLTGLTAYQALTEILKAQAGQSVFIAGGSGGFGQIAVPIAKYLGLKVIVSGSSKSKESIMQLGADIYLDYKKEKYWEVLEKVDFVIDAVGKKEIDHELSILKSGGKLVSLVAGPNKQFAIEQKLPKWKQLIFGIAGAKLDKKAKRKNISYNFLFVRTSGKQLNIVTKIIEKENIVPIIDSHEFTLQQINEALTLVQNGHPKGKVIIKIS